jgi:hypothetical protein
MLFKFFDSLVTPYIRCLFFSAIVLSWLLGTPEESMTSHLITAALIFFLFSFVSKDGLLVGYTPRRIRNMRMLQARDDSV